MSSNNVPADALACVEKEILYTEEAIHQQTVLLYNLCAKRNSFLPISHLPPETLESIFIYGAHDYYERDGSGYFALYIPTWVNVLYVCRHWHNIAVNFLTLWTYHFNTSLHWTEKLLLRSKEASLKISCICLYDQYEGVSWWSSLLFKIEQQP